MSENTWRPKNSGILSPTDVKDGDTIKLLELPYSSPDGRFTNVKVELADGTHKLGSISDFSGNNLAREWGTDMTKWVGRYVRINIREAKATGNLYIAYFPTDKKDEVLATPAVTPPPSVPYPTEDIHPDDIPF